MKTATSLTLIAVGAIIAFAITAHLAFLNLQVTGWVLILTGIAGALITRNSWLRRTLVAGNRPGTLAASSTRHARRAASPRPTSSLRRPPTPPWPGTRSSRNTPTPDAAPTCRAGPRETGRLIRHAKAQRLLAPDVASCPGLQPLRGSGPG